MTIYLQAIDWDGATVDEITDALDGLQILASKREKLVEKLVAWLRGEDKRLKRFTGASVKTLHKLAKRWVRSGHAGRNVWWGPNRDKWLRWVENPGVEVEEGEGMRDVRPEDVAEEEEDEEEEVQWSWPRDEEDLCWAVAHLFSVLKQRFRRVVKVSLHSLLFAPSSAASWPTGSPFRPRVLSS